MLLSIYILYAFVQAIIVLRLANQDDVMLVLIAAILAPLVSAGAILYLCEKTIKFLLTHGK